MAERMNPNNPTTPTKFKTRAIRRKERLTKTVLIFLSVLAVLALVVAIGYNWAVDHYIDKVNIVTKETELVFETEMIVDTEETTRQETETETFEIEELEHNGELNADNIPLICDTKYVKNILILAVDSRGSGTAGRSDTMILASVNSKTNKVVLCSFMRDILAKYPMTPKSPVAGKYDRLNHAHAYGGPELTMAVLKETFNIEVNYYVKVNFSAFCEIVDAMGGLDMELTSAEAKTINRILNALITVDKAANKQLKVTRADFLKSTEAGVHHLTGVQALSHARNRVNGSDYARTQRQRDVIQAMAKKATTLSLPQLNKLLNTVLPKITTNMPKEVLKEMVGNVPSYLTYEILSTRIPGNGMFKESNYKLIPDLKKNCDMLYELVYGEKPPAASQSASGNYAPVITTKAPTTTTTAPTTTTAAPTTTTVPPSSSSVPSSSSTPSSSTTTTPPSSSSTTPSSSTEAGGTIQQN